MSGGVTAVDGVIGCVVKWAERLPSTTGAVRSPMMMEGVVMMEWVDSDGCDCVGGGRVMCVVVGIVVVGGGGGGCVGGSRATCV